MTKNLLFLHGFATNAKIWNLQIKEFSKDFKVYAFDLDLSSIDGSVNFLNQFIRNQKLDNIVVVGWSMGAFVAIKLYFKLLDRNIIDKIVLVDATPKFVTSKDFSYALSESIFKSFTKRLKKNYKDGIHFFHKLMFNHEKDVKDIEGLVVPKEELAFKALHELANVDVRNLLLEINAPTLLIHGEEDQICLPAAAEFMALEIPGAKLEVIKGCAHAPFIDEPEKFNCILREYVR